MRTRPIVAANPVLLSLLLLVASASLLGCESPPGGPAPIPPADIKSAGIDNFPRIAAKVQQEPVWCWAACAEMILAFHGRAVTQQEIVDRVHGEIAIRNALLKDDYGRPIENGVPDARIVQAATFDEILWAMNPDMQSMRERLEVLRGKMQGQGNRSVEFDLGSLLGAELAMLTSKDPDTIVRSLAAREPAIFVLGGMDGAEMGHAEVAFKVEYVDKGLWKQGSNAVFDAAAASFDSMLTPLFDSCQIVRLHSVDPANGQTRIYTGEEVKKFSLYVTKAKAREILQKRLNSIDVTSKPSRGSGTTWFTLGQAGTLRLDAGALLTQSPTP
jgi:hypothetical protein